MKSMKKVFAALLVVVMILALSVTALAANEANYSNGSGSITISNASKGEEYSAYQIFGATYNETTKSVAYTLDKDSPWYDAVSNSTLFNLTAGDGTNVDYYVSIVGTGEDGEVTDSDNTKVLDFIKNTFASLDLTANFGSTEATGDELVWSNAPYGYYYITSSVGTTVTINQNTPNVTVFDKNSQTPTIPNEGLKTIVVDDEKKTTTTASVGDTVAFRIALNTVNWVTKDNGSTEQVTEYTITDTPNGMEIDKSTVKVTVAGTEIKDYSLTIEEGNMTIVVPWVDNESNSLYDNDVELVVTYSAEITAEAVDGDATNTADAKWNNTSIGNGGSTTVYTYSFDLSKVDGDGKALTGAQFELYDAKTEGHKINLVAVYDENDETKLLYYRPATPEEIEAEDFVSAVIEAGSVTIKGLGNGTYYLEEIQAPDGYNKLTARQELKIENTDLTGTSGVKVVNETGTELPSTGGIGTTIFTVVGIILMAGAAILLITKKRMNGSSEE